MISYAFYIWMIFSPILILIRRPDALAWVKAILLIFPIFGFVAFSTADKFISRHDDVEMALLWFFYDLGFAVTYIAWWEFIWRCYRKQWSKNIFGEYAVSNIILLMASWPTVIVFLFLCGGIIKLLFGQVLLLIVALVLFRGTGEIISNIIDFLI
jgi:hypothetical protein